MNRKPHTEQAKAKIGAASSLRWRNRAWKSMMRKKFKQAWKRRRGT